MAAVTLNNAKSDVGTSGKRVGLVGMGSVGAGWAVTYLAAGFEVLAFDIASDADVRTWAFVEKSWPAMVDLGLTDLKDPPKQMMRFLGLEDLAAQSDIIHENAPEEIELKRAILAEIEAAANPKAVICSSSGGLKPSDLQRDMAFPGRFIIAHPFNPPHLIPLIEVIGGTQTASGTIEWTMAHMRRLGKKPIKVDKEMTAYLANRLQFALLREAVHCLSAGVADARSIDDAVRYALAPRWLIMGALMTFSLAGGSGGMPALLEKFGKSTEAWWADLGAPKLTPDVCEKMVMAGSELAGDRSLDEWISYRDRKLVELFAAQRVGDDPFA